MGRIGAEMLFAFSTPPNADASVASTSGFDAATTRAALPGFGAEVSNPSTPPNADASLAPVSGFDAAATRAALPRFGAEVYATSTPPNADASVERSTSGFDAATTRAALPGFGAEVYATSTPPNADASVERSTSGFGAATTKVALPGFGAEGYTPSTPPNADTSVASTSGFGVVDPKVTKPEPGTGVMSTSVSARMATVFLILRKPVPWRKRRMASCGLGAPVPSGAPWPGPYLSGWPAGIRSASTSSGHFLPSGFEHRGHRHLVLHSTCRLKHLCAV